ncbi:heme-dependent oxidative N-demethylase subunit alpha family protein [Gordonia hongkongensis]|uniref:heme-dependent oxidative N-demethylase subunit alpha family protein n=1 Tax=Gordonia hongkongensis TaxID=1701090 RepID=UPI003EB99062
MTDTLDPGGATTTVAPDLLAGFPFPFPEDRYRYSTNVEPARTPVTTAAGEWGTSVVDIDSEYRTEIDQRAVILAADPTRHAVLPHMVPAAWDAMLTVMGELAATCPGFRLASTGPDTWLWHNEILGIEQHFRYGDPASLPEEPLRYISSQVQEDIALLDQRNGQLHVDAGVVTFAADWSFGFDVGMSFLEIHGPVPRIHPEGVITRAHEFLKRLQPHQPYRRTNWTLTIDRRLDVSTEIYHKWGPDREVIQQVPDDEFGRRIHLRVEVQHLIRLPDSGAVMFLIRTYMLPLEQLATVEVWRRRTAEVLAELPGDMADYKGIIKFRDRAAQWLRAAAPATQETTGAGMPRWPAWPPAVDTTGAAFLVVAIGDDPAAAHVSRNWVAAAEAAGGTRLVVLDSLGDAVDRSALQSALDECRTGTRVLVTGGQYDVMTALAMARNAGAVAAELSCYVRHTRDLPLYCAHCRETFRAEAVVGGVVACPGCARDLEVHEHHSPVMGSFLASAVGGDE